MKVGKKYYLLEKDIIKISTDMCIPIKDLNRLIVPTRCSEFINSGEFFYASFEGGGCWSYNKISISCFKEYNELVQEELEV